MCGIVGLVTTRGDAGAWRGTIADAMTLMQRRGPDSSGLWSDGVSCTMGFRRLAILDLTDAGNQPMVSRDGRFALVFNGELYNFREIAAGLRHRGVTFRSTGDAEVVLYALAEYGVSALERFNGMFALALFDTQTRTLLVARDHAGIKPLYLLRGDDGVLFASQYDQILSHPWAVGRAVDEAALGMYLQLGYLPPPWALIEGTSAVEPGTWRSYTAGGSERRGRFFTLPPCREPEWRGPEALEAVDAAVTAAVRRQLVSDVPVGVFLSGGIDSPLVASKMREAADPAWEIPAFTVGTGGDRHDESDDARRYAGALGVRHVVRQITERDALDLLDDVVAAYSEPHDDYSIFPTLLVSRLAREEVTVALSGDGGDDLFWGYPGRMVQPLRAGRAGWLGRLVAAARGAGTAPGDTGGAFASLGADQLRRQRFVPMRWLTRIFPALPPLPPAFTLYDFHGGGVNEAAQWLRWNEYSGHLVRVLQKVDRASMHESLEVRVPLLDREVVDVASRIDWRSCVHLRRNVGKLPLRAALERHSGFQTMPKRGFTVPMSSWLRGTLRERLEDLVLDRTDFLGLPVVQETLRAYAQRHRLGLEDSPWLLWRLLSLALWEARHYRPVAHHA